MKNFLSFLFFLSIITTLRAQQGIKLHGIVVEQNSKFDTGELIYLDNTTVKSSDTKVVAISDVMGEFELTISDKIIGDMICVSASKEGFQFVNDEELKMTMLVEKTMPLKVILSKQGELYKKQLAYIDIAKGIAQDIYDERTDILDKTGSEGEVLMAQIGVEFNQTITEVIQGKKLLLKQLIDAKNQAKAITNKFVTTNLDDENISYQNAFRAFLAKDINRALMILDSMDIRGNLELQTTTRDRKDNITETLERKRRDINQCIFQAKLHTLKYEFEQAEEMYELAMEYDTTNVNLIFGYYALLKKRNKNEKAILLYEKAISIYKRKSETSPATYTPLVAEMLNSTGIFKSDNKDRVGAEKDYNEALSIYRTLSKESPKKYLPLLGLTFNYLADLKKENEDIYSAHKDYDEALFIYRNLAETNPDEFLPKAANVLNNLGNIRSDNNEPILAKVYYKESLSIYRKLAKKSPVLYLSNIAMVLNNLANLKSDNLKEKGANRYYQEAIDIYRTLVKRGHIEYLSYLAATLNNFGLVKNAKKDFKGALKDCEESLAIRRELSKDKPSMYLSEVAMSLNNIGMIKNDKGDIAEGQKDYEEAISIYEELSIVNPSLYLSDLATTRNNLGVLKNDNGDKTDSKEEYEKALAIYEKLAEENPGIYNLDVCMTYINIALYYQDKLKSGDNSAKAKGLDIMKAAKKRMDIYSDENMTIVTYKYSIKQLTKFFEKGY